MKRREFVAGLGSAAAWPVVARAQQPMMPVIGFLANRSANDSVDLVAAFHRGLKEAGFTEGQNATIEFRWADNQYDQLPALADDLVRRRVAVLFAQGAPASVAAKAATATIPTVFYMGEDPVSLGLVSSFNRPGGNMTGVGNLSSAVLGKRLEFLREIVPQTSVFVALINPRSPNAEISTRDAREAARTLNERIQILEASTVSDLEMVFATLGQLKGSALLIAPDGAFISLADQLAALAMRHGIPASHERRVFPAAGGLMSYGSSELDGVRQAGVYVGRILKGEKPSSLPVMQPTKLELVVNLKTAKTLGIEVPERLLATADELIQ
jgi:putative tryptophan/tyrosine transport system substrate-binding protein